MKRLKSGVLSLAVILALARVALAQNDTHGTVQTLVASAARTTTGNSGLLSLSIPCDHMNVILNVSAASGTTPTLDLYLQYSTDGGTTFFDFAHYTQVTAAKTTVIQWSELNSSNASKTDTTTGAAVLAAGTVINGPIVPSAVRVSWVIGGTTPSFTFSVVSIESRL